MVKLISIPSFLVLAIALVVGGRRLYSSPSPKWHEGERWEKLLEIYDEIAAKQYQGCESRLLPSKFGDTQVFVCGSPENPPVVLLHGISTNSLMFGEWIVPKLSESRYIVAVDTLCDMGRSRPLDGDTLNCPQTQEETAEWINSLCEQLNVTKPYSLIGYSFGSFLASCVAMKTPEAVDKLVLMAPAAVFAPIELGWLVRAISFGMLGSLVGWESEYAERLRDWFFGYMTTTQDPSLMSQNFHPKLRTATDAAGTAQVGVRPVVYSVEELQEMNTKIPTLMIIGEEETVINADVAIEKATQAGIQVKAYPKAGHMLFAEYPRNDIIDVTLSFLDAPSE